MERAGIISSGVPVLESLLILEKSIHITVPDTPVAQTIWKIVKHMYMLIVIAVSFLIFKTEDMHIITAESDIPDS